MILPEPFPLLHYPRPEFCSQLLIRRFRRFRLGWRINRITESHLQRRETLERLIPRPRFMKAFNRQWHNWYLQMNGKNRRALLEVLWRAVDRPFAFWIENECKSLS